MDQNSMAEVVMGRNVQLPVIAQTALRMVYLVPVRTITKACSLFTSTNKKYLLTFSQTSDFRLLQTEEVYRGQI